MNNLKEIEKIIEDSQSLKLLAAVYSDVAGSKLKNIRSLIEQNRQFVSELATVFHIIKIAAEKQKIDVNQNKSGTANVVLTSNHRFFGGLENRLMNFYLAHLALSPGESFVIGKTGKVILDENPLPGTVKSLIFVKDVPNTQELNSLATQLSGFEKILVYHAKMQTVLFQRPAITEIGGLTDISSEIDPRLAYYIFEPEIKKMVDFFDQQITKVLLGQAFLEAELARTAARLVSMEQSQRNADRAIREDDKFLIRAKANLANVRMEEAVMGVARRQAYE